MGGMTAAFIACKWHAEKHVTDSLLVESWFHKSTSVDEPGPVRSSQCTGVFS